MCFAIVNELHTGRNGQWMSESSVAIYLNQTRIDGGCIIPLGVLMPLISAGGLMFNSNITISKLGAIHDVSKDMKN